MLRATVFVMEYLSTLDAGFLEVEDSDPHVVARLATLSVAPQRSTARGKMALIDDRGRAASGG